MINVKMRNTIKEMFKIVIQLYKKNLNVWISFREQKIFRVILSQEFLMI